MNVRRKNITVKMQKYIRVSVSSKFERRSSGKKSIGGDYCQVPNYVDSCKKDQKLIHLRQKIILASRGVWWPLRPTFMTSNCGEYNPTDTITSPLTPSPHR